jgi:hypothetical protein
MSYEIRDYQKGYETDQARIGIEVACHWIWPYAYHLEGLLKLHAQPDFDPETRHYAFLDGKMVGYQFSVVSPQVEGEPRSAVLDFPRVLPGHEAAAELLVERAFEVLLRKGVRQVTGRVTTMVPGDVRLAEKKGFRISDWGYKVYYSYEMAWGKLPGECATEIDPHEDLDEVAAIAARWYKRPVVWCREHLAEWHAEGVISHPCVRQEGRMAAACFAAPNDVRPSTAAIYSIYTPDVASLRPLLRQVVNRCVDSGIVNLIVDLVNQHRPYEHVYQELGFQKVAEWARCEKELSLARHEDENLVSEGLS